MTEEVGTPPSGQRSGRSLAWRLGTPAVLILCGALFVVSGINSGGVDLRPGRYTDLPSVAEAERRDYDALLERRNELDAEVDRLTDEVSGGGLEQLRSDVGRLQDPAGLTPRTGSGVTITLSDAPDELFDAAEDAEDPAYPDPNEFIVHQQDIQAVANALWKGGARAVTIAGQRIVTTTGIKCEGSVVTLQGAPYPQPFVIQAVGDPAALTAAVHADPLVSGYRADAANEQIQIGWTFEEESQVEAPAYDGLLDMEYAEPLG
jgi:uncharacterized protein YlxW (UPF0749 family)